MATITFTLSDTPQGSVAIQTNFVPAVGQSCSMAQAAALDILARTRKIYGLEPTLKKNAPAGSKS